MNAKLKQLLASVDPTCVRLEMELRSAQALNTFDVPGAVVPDYPAFRQVIARFFRHADNVLLALRSPLPVDEYGDFGRACRVLMGELGPDGDKTAANMAMYGVEGGLYRVLNIILRHLAEEYTTNEIRARVSAYWSSLPADEKLHAVAEYLNAYGHLLPADITDGGAARVYLHFPRFLEKHPELVRKLREVGRKY